MKFFKFKNQKHEKAFLEKMKISIVEQKSDKPAEFKAGCYFYKTSIGNYVLLENSDEVNTAYANNHIVFRSEKTPEGLLSAGNLNLAMVAEFKEDIREEAKAQLAAAKNTKDQIVPQNLSASPIQREKSHCSVMTFRFAEPKDLAECAQPALPADNFKMGIFFYRFNDGAFGLIQNQCEFEMAKNENRMIWKLTTEYKNLQNKKLLPLPIEITPADVIGAEAKTSGTFLCFEAHKGVFEKRFEVSKSSKFEANKFFIALGANTFTWLNSIEELQNARKLKNVIYKLKKNVDVNELFRCSLLVQLEETAASHVLSPTTTAANLTLQKSTSAGPVYDPNEQDSDASDAEETTESCKTACKKRCPSGKDTFYGIGVPSVGTSTALIALKLSMPAPLAIGIGLSGPLATGILSTVKLSEAAEGKVPLAAQGDLESQSVQARALASSEEKEKYGCCHKVTNFLLGPRMKLVVSVLAGGLASGLTFFSSDETDPKEKKRKAVTFGAGVASLTHSALNAADLTLRPNRIPPPRQ